MQKVEGLKSFLGAALAFVGEGAGSEAVRGAAIEVGTQIAG